MVPRPLAPARAMRSHTCAHVIQPCQVNHIHFFHGFICPLPTRQDCVLPVHRAKKKFAGRGKA